MLNIIEKFSAKRAYMYIVFEVIYALFAQDPSIVVL